MGAGSGSACLVGARRASVEGEMNPTGHGYLKLVEKGNRPVMGECAESDHVGWTEISVFKFEIPRVADKLHPRKSSDFSIRKEMDRIGPLLFNHLTSNEPFESATIDVTYADRTGESPKVWGRVQFTTAVVVSIKNTAPDKFDPNAQESVPTIQDVMFTYEKVEFTRPAGGDTDRDGWR